MYFSLFMFLDFQYLFLVGRKKRFRPKNGLVVKISKFEYSPFRDISHEELGLFLRCCEFLHFEIVVLSYDDSGFQSIDKKCHLFVKHLKPLKAAFNDSTKIEFNANMGLGDGQNNFRDPLQLLSHLRNELLPVCDSARHYEFTFGFYSHKASTATTDILDSILRMPPINTSTNVKFNLYQHNGILPQLLPVDAISAWLDRSNDLVMKCKQQQKTPLELRVYLSGVENVHEFFEHFKKVNFANSFVNIIKSAYLKNNKFSNSDSDTKPPKICIKT